MSEYDKQAADFLDKTETKFTAKFIEHNFYFDDDHAMRDIYEITLERGTRKYSFKFGQSIAASGVYVAYTSKGAQRVTKAEGLKLRAKGIQVVKNSDYSIPSAYDVLSCLTKYDPGTFENFCAEFGYDEDSRKAEKVYNAVVDEYHNLKMLYSDSELEAMQEIQ